jgi:Ca2+-binding EF-hand superfamily protein
LQAKIGGKKEKANQFKYILKEFDVQGKETVSFSEFIGATEENVDAQDSRKRTKINQ